MTGISAQMFLEILRSPSEHKSFCTVEKENDDTYTIVFDNKSIPDIITLPTSTGSNYNVKFINNSNVFQISGGRFDYQITFQNSKIENIYISGNKIKSISLINSSLEILMLQNEAQLVSLNISTFGRINVLSVSSKSKIDELNLSDSAKLNNCMISDSSIVEIKCAYQSEINSINFSKDCNVQLITNYYWGYIGSIYLNNGSSIAQICTWENSFTENFTIIENSIVNCIKFDKGSFIGDLKIEGKIDKATIQGVLAHIIIGNISLTDSIKIDNSDIERLSIEKNHSGSLNLYIENSTISYLNITKSFFNNSDLINISNSKLHNIVINNVHNSGKITFNGILELKEWNFHLRDENKKVILNDESTGFITMGIDKTFVTFSDFLSSLTILDSNLGETIWINCNFESFDELNFSNSKLLDCFLASIKFPFDYNFHTPLISNENNIELQNQKRLFYGQIKSIYLKQGDQPRAALTQSIELEAYRNQLKIERTKLESPNKLWDKINVYKLWDKINNNNFIKKINKKKYWDNFKDRKVLLINKTTSNYGTNWVKSIFITILLSWVSFLLYCFAIGYRSGGDWNKFFELFSYSFQYLNPFRDEDSGEFFKLIDNDGLRITPIARIIDYLSRVIIAFMVYQTISAFRRLGKSSN